MDNTNKTQPLTFPRQTKEVMVFERFQRALVKTGRVTIYRVNLVPAYVPRTKAVR